MPIAKRCEVCGGSVTPIDDQGPFGSCDSCGIVYALKNRLQGTQSYETPKDVELQSEVEPRKVDTQRRTFLDDTQDITESSSSLWRCPDCGTVLKADNDSDMEFVKREHIREYHPNRSG